MAIMGRGEKLFQTISTLVMRLIKRMFFKKT
jgi:hypothetical protein